MNEPLLKQPEFKEFRGKLFILSKIPAIAGREIGFKYPTSAIPKLGDYGVSEEVMLKLMSYVGIPREGLAALRLNTRDLVDAHVEDAEMLFQIERAMLEYNFSFFRDGRISNFFGDIAQKARTLITEISMVLSALSSEVNKQPTQNSETISH